MEDSSSLNHPQTLKDISFLIGLHEDSSAYTCKRTQALPLTYDTSIGGPVTSHNSLCLQHCQEAQTKYKGKHL